MLPALALADSLRREGRFDDAREQIEAGLAGAGSDAALRLACAVQLSKIERSAGRLALALKVLLDAASLVELCGDDYLRARYYHGLGCTYQLSGESNQASIEYAGAAYHLSLAGLIYDAGCVENNVALLLADARRFPEAHDHIDRARACFAGMDVKLAEVDESEAQIYLDEENADEALRLVTSAVSVFILYGETELKRKALPTLIKAAADCQVNA